MGSAGSTVSEGTIASVFEDAAIGIIGPMNPERITGSVGTAGVGMAIGTQSGLSVSVPKIAVPSSLISETK